MCRVTITTRLARPQEFDRIGELTVAAYLRVLPSELDYIAALRDAGLRAAGGELIVAVDARDGDVLGSVLWCPPGSAYREIAREGEGEFRTLAVAPEAQGRGVGRLLVEDCLRRARDAQLCRVVLSSAQEMVAAQRLYRRLGFTRLPERDWSPVPTVNLLAFARGDLSAGDARRSSP